MESFFVISSASLTHNPSNTRSEFINRLFKDIDCSNKKVFIKPDYCVFNNTFRSYSSRRDNLPDIIFRLNHYRETFKLNDCQTVKDIQMQITRFFQRCVKELRVNLHQFFRIEVENNKMTLAFGHGEVLFSDNLLNLLRIDEDRFLKKKDVKISDFYNIIRNPGDPLKVIKSFEHIYLNESPLEYINIECQQIKPYQGEDFNINRKVILSVPINDKLRSTFYYNDFNGYFEIETSYLREMEIKYLQPNNVRVFFETGPPNIIKFHKMF